MQKPLRIAIVTNNYTPYSGGVVSSILTLTAELQKAGHEVFIITLDFLGKQHDDPAWVIRIPSLMRFKYHKNPMAIPLFPRHKLEEIIKKIQPDVIHTQHPFLLGKIALKVAKKYGIPIFFTYHSMYEKYAEHYIPLPGWMTKKPVAQRVISFCKKVDGIIAPVPNIKQHLENYKVARPIQVIPSGLQPVFFQQSVQLKSRDKQAPFHLLLVSRFNKEKNIPFLLDVFSRLDQEQFIFTLIGFGELFESVKNYAYQILKLSLERVQFIHRPEKIIIADYYQKADLFIFSSVTEVQGTVLQEAMAGGTPVVALHDANLQDIVLSGQNGFLVDSADQMIEKINEIAQDPVLHKTLQKGAFAFAQEYAPQLMAERVVQFYRQALQN